MSKTKIEWTDYTWNPITGCSKCSPGCQNCYAERMAGRLAAIGLKKYQAVTTDKKWNGRLFFDEKAMSEPLKWKKPRRIFVNSMGDTFHGTASIHWIGWIMETARYCKQHTFIMLTKRVENMWWYFDYENSCPSNVWAGVTVVNQSEMDEKGPVLSKIDSTPVRFISIEPMLGPIIIAPEVLKSINWVICGGESGPKARPMHPDWVRSLRDQCKAAGVPFMFKQWGEWAPVEGSFDDVLCLSNRKSGCQLWKIRVCDDKMAKVGKKAAGRLLDGELWDQYPTQKMEHYK